MTDKVFNFGVSSPQELQKQLEGVLGENKKTESGFAEINLYGPGVLVRQFDLTGISPRELKSALKLEATEILSLLPEEIELDYQTFSEQQDGIKGFFVAIPKKALREYLSCFDQAKIMPVKMTADIIAAVGNFLLQHQDEKKNFCLLSFSKVNIINLAVFINGQCKLLREVHYEQPSDAEEEVINSLKYVCGRSFNKQLNKVYFSGELSGREALVARLREKIDVDPLSGDSAASADVASAAAGPEVFLQINLLKRYALSLPLRNRILQISNIAIGICLLSCFLLALSIIKKNLLVGDLRSSFSSAEYDYAVGLQQKVKALNYAR